MPIAIRLRVSLFFLLMGTAIAIPWAGLVALFKALL